MTKKFSISCAHFITTFHDLLFQISAKEEVNELGRNSNFQVDLLQVEVKGTSQDEREVSPRMPDVHQAWMIFIINEAGKQSIQASCLKNIVEREIDI